MPNYQKQSDIEVKLISNCVNEVVLAKQDLGSEVHLQKQLDYACHGYYISVLLLI